MPAVSTKGKADRYAVEVRQFRQQILPPGLPQTTVWGYGDASHPSTFGYPARTIEATGRTGRCGSPGSTTWSTPTADFRPHLLPVDPTLHWANPPGGDAGRDTPAHVHLDAGPVPRPGADRHAPARRRTPPRRADGYPRPGTCPTARNIPRGFATDGPCLRRVREKSAALRPGAGSPGQAAFQLRQRPGAGDAVVPRPHARHDPAQRVRRPGGLLPAARRRAGPARGRAARPGAAARRRPGRHPLLRDPAGHPGPLVHAPTARCTTRTAAPFPDAFAGPYMPGQRHRRRSGTRRSSPTPSWSTAAPGRSWRSSPAATGCGCSTAATRRFLILKIATSATAPRPAAAALPFWQIGTDGGFLPEPVQLEQLLLGPGRAGRRHRRLHRARRGHRAVPRSTRARTSRTRRGAGTDYQPANPATTGQVMKLAGRSRCAARTPASRPST